MTQEDLKGLKDFKEVLETTICNSNKIFISMHVAPDLDAIASSIGLYYICKYKLKKECYIIINEATDKLEAGVKKVIEKERESIPFIDTQKFLSICDKNDALILTDVNKINRIYVSDNLDKFKNIFIIDHHDIDDKTIDTDKKFISCNVSSASEVVTKLFSEFHQTIPSNIATYLLAGIKLDTVNYSKNTDADTLDMMKKLLKSGALNEAVQEFFQENYESDVRIADLLKKLKFYIFQYAIACDNGDTIYTREELAKAADKTLQYGMDASFIIGYINEDKTKIGISGRSNGRVNIGKIMSELQGGGNPTSGASVLEISPEEVEEQLLLKLKGPYYKDKNAN